MGMLLLAAGMQAAGQIQQGRAASAEGKAAQKMANYNAAVAEQSAKATELKTKFDQGRAAEEAARRMASLRTKSAARGGMSSVFDVLQMEQAKESELDNMLIGYEGRQKAAQYRSQATMDRMQGKIYRMKGKNLATASYMGAGSSLLTGFGDYTYRKKTLEAKGYPNG